MKKKIDSVNGLTIKMTDGTMWKIDSRDSNCAHFLHRWDIVDIQKNILETFSGIDIEVRQVRIPAQRDRK